MISTHSTTTPYQIHIPSALPSALHIGIAAGLRRAAQIQRAPVVVPATVLARWGGMPEAVCAQALDELVRLDQGGGGELTLPPGLIDHYMGLYLPGLGELLQAFSPALLRWADVGAYALLAAGHRQPAGALARLQEVGLVTRAHIAVAPAGLPKLLDQAERGLLTTLDGAGRRVRVGLTAQGRGQRQLCGTGCAREAGAW